MPPRQQPSCCPPPFLNVSPPPTIEDRAMHHRWHWAIAKWGRGAQTLRTRVLSLRNYHSNPTQSFVRHALFPHRSWQIRWSAPRQSAFRWRPVPESHPPLFAPRSTLPPFQPLSLRHRPPLRFPLRHRLFWSKQKSNQRKWRWQQIG